MKPSMGPGGSPGQQRSPGSPGQQGDGTNYTLPPVGTGVVNTFGEPRPQRRRGISFKQDCMGGAGPFQKLKSKFGRRRAPSMIHEPTKHMIPPQRREYKDRLSIILDLDETLIYAREGPLYARPYLDELLAVTAEKCETLVWTAGTRAYAQAVIKNIDPNHVIEHCIYRHEKWFSGVAGYQKDLSLLGRDLRKTLIIENTPDCIRGYEYNGILVPDYEGGESPDLTLPAVTALIMDICERGVPNGEITMQQYISSSPMLVREVVPTDTGDEISCYCLNINNVDWRKLGQMTREGVGRVNKDLSSEARQQGLRQ